MGSRQFALDTGGGAPLASLARARIWFGHRSVGAGLLEGAAAVLARARVPMRVLDTRDPAWLVPGVLAHGALGRNGDAAAKIDDFAHVIAGRVGDSVDLALMKLCWADVGARTDVAALFARYVAACTALAQSRSTVALAHVTVPLTAFQRGPRSWARRALRFPPGGLRENAVRDRFNALLQSRFGAAVFDLATLEATRPDGAREESRWKGRAVPGLAAAWSADGGHLDARGREYVGRAFVSFLAARLAEAP